MDTLIQQAGLQLGQLAVSNTAGVVREKIQAIKARRNDKETITELDEIINSLLSDKSDLLRIAKTFEEELVSQRISDSDIRFIADNVVPAVRALASASETTQADNWLDSLQALLSIETVTILQLLGFNFRQAIGEPLTELIARLISRTTPIDPALQLEAQKASAAQISAMATLAKDPQAVKRFRELLQ